MLPKSKFPKEKIVLQFFCSAFQNAFQFLLEQMNSRPYCKSGDCFFLQSNLTSLKTGESDKTLTRKSVGQLVTANLTSWTLSDGCLSFSVTRQKILEPKFGHQLSGAMAKLANSQLDEN